MVIPLPKDYVSPFYHRESDVKTLGEKKAQKAITPPSNSTSEQSFKMTAASAINSVRGNKPNKDEVEEFLRTFDEASGTSAATRVGTIIVDSKLVAKIQKQLKEIETALKQKNNDDILNPWNQLQEIEKLYVHEIASNAELKKEVTSLKRLFENHCPNVLNEITSGLQKLEIKPYGLYVTEQYMENRKKCYENLIGYFQQMDAIEKILGNKNNLLNAMQREKNNAVHRLLDKKQQIQFMKWREGAIDEKTLLTELMSLQTQRFINYWNNKFDSFLESDSLRFFDSHKIYKDLLFLETLNPMLFSTDISAIELKKKIKSWILNSSNSGKEWLAFLGRFQSKNFNAKEWNDEYLKFKAEIKDYRQDHILYKEFKTDAIQAITLNPKLHEKRDPFIADITKLFEEKEKNESIT